MLAGLEPRAVPTQTTAVGSLGNPLLSQEKPANGAETPIIRGDVWQLD
jgi:hypothetical protein